MCSVSDWYMLWCGLCMFCVCFFFFQAEDGIRDLVRSRGLGDVYKRQGEHVEDAGQRVQHFLLADDGDVLAAVARDHHVLDLSLIHI